MPPPNPPTPPILLFGYDSSLFTQKARLALRLLRLPSTLIRVPPRPPRPLLLRPFALPYRKIPVLAVGRDLYVDTALIAAVLDARFASGAATLFPDKQVAPLARLWAATCADRPLFRVMTGLVPGRVWRARFGVDRGRLVGHALDAAKLAAKRPRNVAALDAWLSAVEGRFADGGGGWLFGAGAAPGWADVALWEQLEWGVGVAGGRGVGDLTGGEEGDGGGEVAEGENGEGRGLVGRVWNEGRYPGLWRWFEAFRAYVEALPVEEERVEGSEEEKMRVVVERLGACGECGLRESMMKTSAVGEGGVDELIGLVPGAEVVIAPDDTGKDE
ncbi:hypothetical protein FB451DRAFT_40340 [Neofusicoccum parvum]|nr:hypothetical protein FB451DRAFT_40340 [Neofusicoccum parvum]